MRLKVGAIGSFSHSPPHVYFFRIEPNSRAATLLRVEVWRRHRIRVRTVQLPRSECEGHAKLIGKVLDGIVCSALFKYVAAKYSMD
jgi:hypothetical protein